MYYSKIWALPYYPQKPSVKNCDWVEKGIMIIFIEHIHVYDYRNKQFGSFGDNQILYGVSQSDYFNYCQLKKCIPTAWKTKLKSEEILYRTNEYTIDKIVPQLKTCRFIYNMLLQKKTLPQKQENKWKDSLTSDLSWKKIYCQIIIITNDSKLRRSQYKYLMHSLPYNLELF